MRLSLPTGEDGAPRDYPLDGVLDLSRITLNETIELKRVTGMSLRDVHKGLGLLTVLLDQPDSVALVAMSEELELMQAYRAMVWLVRNRAGDTASDGSTLTVEQAVDFPFAGLNVKSDPGDLIPVDDDEDPQKPSQDGNQGTGDGTDETPTPGHS